jgi:hypothetical protein
MSLTLTGFGGTDRAAGAGGAITLFPSLFTNTNTFYAAIVTSGLIDRQSKVSSLMTPVSITSTRTRQSHVTGGSMVNERSVSASRMALIVSLFFTKLPIRRW